MMILGIIIGALAIFMFGHWLGYRELIKFKIKEGYLRTEPAFEISEKEIDESLDSNYDPKNYKYE